jgi:N4-gp56 family major capsid protein
MAITNTSTVAGPVGEYYDKRFLMRAEENFVLMALGQSGTIPKNQGKTVVWNRFTNPTAKTSPLTEGTDPTPTGLTATLISATLAQYGNYERISDILETTAVSSVVKEAIDLLAYEAAYTFDEIIKGVIIDHGQAAYAGTSTARNSLQATDTFGVSQIRKALRTLRKLAAKPHTGTDYVAIAHPDVNLASFYRKVVEKCLKLQGTLTKAICSETQKWGRSTTIIGQPLGVEGIV